MNPVSLRKRLRRIQRQEQETAEVRSQTNKQVENNKTVEFQQLLNSTIIACKKLFSKCLNETSSKAESKRSLMAAIFQSRILIGRLLALYRWHRQSTISSSTLTEGKFNNMINHVVRNLQNINSEFSKVNNLRPEEEAEAEEKLEVILANEISYSTIFIKLISYDFPNSITNVIIRSTDFSITIFDRVTLSIRLTKDEQFKLKNMSFKTDFRIKRLQVQNIIAAVSSILDSGVNVFTRLDRFFNKCLNNIALAEFADKLMKYESKYKFTMQHKDGVITIILPEGFSQFRTFNVYSQNQKIVVQSCHPQFLEGAAEFQYVTFNDTEPEFLIPKLFETALKSFMKVYMDLLDKYVKPLILSLKVTQLNYHLYFEFNDKHVMTIGFEPSTCVASIIHAPGIFINAEDVVHCINQGILNTRKVFRLLMNQYALTSLFFNNPNAFFWEKWKYYARDNYIPVISYSSCPDYRFKLCANQEVPSIELLLDQDEYKENCHKISSLPPAIAAVYLQIRKDLGSAAVSTKSRITYSPDSTSIAAIEFSPTGKYSVHIIGNKYNRCAYKIHGNFVSFRFSDYFAHISVSFSKLLNVAKQISQSDFINSNYDLYPTVDVNYMPEHIPAFHVSIRGMLLLASTTRSVDLILRSDQGVKLEIEFARYCKVQQCIYDMITTGNAINKLSAFLSSAMMQFCIFQDTFLAYSNRPSWSLSALSKDNYFSLIFQRHFTMNISWKSTHVFHVIIPKISPSLVLQIALRKFPGFSPEKRLSHPTLSVHTSQLSSLKMYIEDFFLDRDALLYAKFHPVQQTDEKMKVFEPNEQSQWFHLQALMLNSGLEVRLSQWNPTADRILKAFSMFSQTRNLMRVRLIFMSRIAQRPESVGIAVARTMEEISNLPGIDWMSFVRKATFEQEQEIQVKFSSVVFEHSQFSIQISLVDDTTRVRVTSDIEGADDVVNFSTFNKWIGNIIHKYM
ncbi:hypothetical protein TVAG_420220 [Trichomonas vaginalis G3]|uniref:Uncharacterized protein n=1 Tax=Trichomonas vaginalis (strain ATCC PRA-98 / G3) TaxID=412133 RepID=A2ED45_TRIV3|nr:hypothetical protein TVAGG3_0424830 [Trichomonas vaginalis G3]EAY09400.1 hypothetical protein TVAG_420220 [Trichomonas vaginalis G3]KAI5536319.1 hypothetical protein TVAGG3_0424830 [Trichomonas vaginalis G3]|eukprot:XP_001321623.1 hypothetical protein [Trichomonas vaginalis G3]